MNRTPHLIDAGRCCWAFVLLPICLLALGCQSGPRVVPVKGTATRAGKPLPHLTIQFFPEEGGRPSTARTDAEGLFELQFDQSQKGALVGPHKVIVAFLPTNPKEEMDMAAGRFVYHPDKNAILEKYGDRNTTKLRVEIGKEETDLQLRLD